METKLIKQSLKIASIFLHLISIEIVAQEINTSKSPIAILSIDAGASIVNKTTQNNSMLGNGISTSINAYFPLWKIKNTPTFKATFGLNVGIGFQTHNNKTPHNNQEPNVINISGQSDIPILEKQIGQPKWKFTALPEAGLQACFTIHNFSITPILNVGYAKLKGNTYTLTQRSTINGKEEEKNIYSQETNDIKGLMVSPKLRVGYSFKKVSIYLEGSYLFVNSGTTKASTFKPNGDPLKDGTYSIDQIINGKYIEKETTQKFSAYGVKFGVSIPLGKGINEAGIKKQEEAPKNNLIDLSTTPTAPQPQNQSIINTTKSNTKDKIISFDDEPTAPQPNQAQDFNSCRSNRERGQLKTNPNDTTSAPSGDEQNELRKGWDGSVKGNSKGIQEAGIKKQEDAPKNNLIDLNTEPTAPQPQNQSIVNTTKSNTKDKIISFDDEPTAPQPNQAQDFNSCRSNRERGQLKTNPNDSTSSPSDDKLNELKKNWDGSVKGNSK